MKIIIDTNLLVASMFNKSSASAQIVNLIEKGEVEVMWHRKIRNEAELITNGIARSASTERLDLDKIFKKENEVKKMPRVEDVSEDREDDKFLACALAAGADMIVSNDRDLLSLKSFEGIPVYNSVRALEIIRSGKI
ncbi:MAG: putative toxin-antitoxin system toxin component, PIN family [Candidatus Omnitrophota bacterium]|jgi:putative PIN family toxin of toxin-antitoxin system